MNLKIRLATANDLSSILALYAQPEMDDGKILSLDQAETLYKKIKSYPNYNIYVAVDGNKKIVGSFALLIMDNLGHMGSPSGIVEDVVVDPKLHGKGVGKQMMQYVLEVCRENQCYKLVLSSNLKRKQAHRFYENLGFKQHGISFLIEPVGAPI